MQSQPPGSMLAVPLASAELETFIGPAVSVAAENGPALSVLSGPNEAIDEIELKLLARHIPGRRLRTSHAFHSCMMDPIVEPFLEAVAASAPKPPQLPYISNVTGTWIKSAEATKSCLLGAAPDCAGEILDWMHHSGRARGRDIRRGGAGIGAYRYAAGSRQG